MINIQSIEKQFNRLDGALDIHSIFLTIQGEGPFTGQRAVFIRLAGCNLQCPGCDTDYTSTRELLSPDELCKIVKEVSNCSPMLVVFTGGEPLRQNIMPTIEALREQGHYFQIETNGSFYLEGLGAEDILVVCSPKTGNLSRKLIPYIHALKYVVKAGEVEEDGLPRQALDHRIGNGGLYRPEPDSPNFPHIYVQPMDEHGQLKNDANLKETVASVMKHGHTLCLQTHKIIGVE